MTTYEGTLIEPPNTGNNTGFTFTGNIYPATQPIEVNNEYRAEYPRNGPALALELLKAEYFGWRFTGQIWSSISLELLLANYFGWLFTGYKYIGEVIEPPFYSGYREIEAPVFYKGIVYDLTNRPIPNAKVFLKSNIAGHFFGAESNLAGEFNLEVPAGHVLTAYVLEWISGLNYEEFREEIIGDIHKKYCKEIARRLMTIGIAHRVEKIREG
jgi:hypothetical protein